MSHLTVPETSTALLALRRLHEPADLLPLEGDKITVGGGQSCTLRLADPGVRPLHCLVTIVPDGLVVRRWADDTLLNGETFSEAPLVVGDRLTIGPVDLELVERHEYECSGDDHDVELHEGFEQSTPETLPSFVETPEVTDADAESEPVNVTSVAAERATHNRQRAKYLVGEIRRSRQAYQDLQISFSDMEAKLATIETERSDLADQRSDLDTQLAQLQAQISELNEELLGVRQNHEEREQQLADQMGELDRQIVERNDIIEQLKVELLRGHSPVETTSSDWVVTEHAEATETIEQESPAEWDSGNANSAETDDQFADWSAVADGQSTDQHGDEVSSIDEVEPVDEGGNNEPSDEPLETQVDADVWDVEVQSNHQFEQEGNEESTCADVDEHSEPTNDLDAVDQLAHVGRVPLGDADSAADGSSNEEELWGRLNSLRAVASDRLHSELGGATDLHSTDSDHAAGWSSTEHEHNDLEQAPLALPDDAPGEAEAIELPTELDQHLSLDTAADRPEDAQLDVNERDEAQDEVIAVDDLQLEAEVDEPTAPVPTTLFDRPAETDAPPAEREEPVSFVEKYQHLLEEEPTSELPSPPPQSEPKPIVATPDDDESIENYMAKMMDRLRGGVDVAANVDPTTKLAVTSASKTSLATVAVEAAPETAEAPLTNLDELKSSPKPEQSTDMSALRDLANNSARQAIQLANNRRARGQAYGNLLLSTVAGGCGAFLVWSSRGALGISLFGGAAAVAAAGYWACRILRSLAQSDDKPQPQVADDPTSEAALPIAGTEFPTESSEAV